MKPCKYCEKLFDETLDKCPYCGAPNDNVARSSNSEPTTIEELKQWYTDHNLPPEDVTRFFIGKDVKEKRAFGIYKDGNGDFVVYKNKDNGQRAIRYAGKDEKYAVNEIYQKLKDEISNQKSNNKMPPKTPNKKPKSDGIVHTLAIIVIIGMIIAGAYLFFTMMSSPDYGYYSYNGSDYYYGSDGWYIYDYDSDDWAEVDDDDIDFIDNWDDYITYSDSDSYSSSSSSYDDDDWDDWGSDWDNDSSWSSSDSWDSGSSDWGSDW